MSDTNKFPNDNRTRIFRRPSEEEILEYQMQDDIRKESELEYKRRQALEDLENERIKKNKIKNKKEKKVIYKEVPIDYCEEEVTKKKSKNGCCFGCFLILVAIVSFLLAGYVVFRGVL